MKDLAAQLAAWKQDAQQRQLARLEREAVMIQARIKDMGVSDAHWRLIEAWQSQGFPDPSQLTFARGKVNLSV